MKKIFEEYEEFVISLFCLLIILSLFLGWFLKDEIENLKMYLRYEERVMMVYENND